MKKLAVLLTNTGTPDAPTPSAVRVYLREFLSDPRVVHLPRWLWLPLLNGVILPLRAKKSAALYQRIWTGDSPLRLTMQALAQALSVALTGADVDARVFVGMNYGNPSMETALADIKNFQPDEFIVLPLFPQYSHTSTASSLDRIAPHLTGLPTPRIIKSYADHPAYIQTLAQQVKTHWAAQGKSHLLISYHGIPKRFVAEGDPYQTECEATTRALVKALGLSESDYTHCYQSQFGYDKWLSPSTQALFLSLPEHNTKHLTVLCPGFPIDCLETLEEIALAGKHTFLTAGGTTFAPLPALNNTQTHVEMLKKIILG